MSCQHAEDVCQHCLEKVHITTEDSPPKLSPKEKEHSHAGKTLTPQEKRNRILFHSSLLAGFGAIGFFCTKLYSKISAHIFDSSLKAINHLWDTLETPSRKE